MPGADQRIDGVDAGGGHPVDRIAGDAECAGDLVGFEKSDAVHLLRQPVGVGADHVGRPFPVLPEEPGAVGGGDAQPLQKDVAFAAGGRLAPPLNDRFRLFRADAGNLLQALRKPVENGQGLVAEVVDDDLRGASADAGNRAGAEEPFDPLRRRRQPEPEFLRPEAVAEFSVLLPAPLRLDVLAGGESAERSAEHMFRAGAVRQPEHGVTAVAAVEENPADLAGDHRMGQRLYLGHRRPPSSGLSRKARTRPPGLSGVKSSGCSSAQRSSRSAFGIPATPGSVTR